MAKRRGRARVGPLLLGMVVVALMLLIVIWMFGGVSGEEFSPQKFSMRRFYYWQIPIARIQVWPVQLNKISGEDDVLAKHIRSNRLNGNVSVSPVRWDIMTMDEVGHATYRGNASILTNYLRQPGAAGMESWLDWSKANPKSAKVLWPLVAQLAEKNLYPIIPDLLEAGRGLNSHEFETKIRELAATQVRAFATAEDIAGENDRAVALAELARQVDPEG